MGSRRRQAGGNRVRLIRLGWRFNLLLGASAVSTVGDGVAFTAFPLLAVHLTSSAVAISAVTAAGIAPWIIVGPVSGAVIDRVDRRRVMLVADLARFGILGVFSICALAGAIDLGGLLFAAAAVCIGSTFFDPASQAIVPELISADPERLGAASSRIFGIELLGQQLAGRAAGGALFALSQALPFAVDSSTFLVSAALIASISGRYRPRNEGPAAREAMSLWHSIAEGARWLLDHRLLRDLTATVGVINFVFGSSEAVLVILAKNRLGLGPTGYGLLLTGMALGGLCGSMLRGTMTRRFHASGVLRGSILLMAAGTMVVGTAPDALACGAGLAITSFAVMLFNVTGMPLRQLLVPAEMRGRVMTAYRIVAMGMAAIGALVGGAVVSAYGIERLYIGGALLILVTALLSGTISKERIDDDLSARRLPVDVTN
jgi:MFS family permease